MGELREKQSRFVRRIADLINHATALGLDLTFGDAYRDPRVTYGHPDSLHRKRLAVDFNLYVNGIWQRDTEAHRELGEYWESLSPECAWGGRFWDGNHYSLRHGGMK